MTGDKENIRNITDNWDKFIESTTKTVISLLTQDKKFHPHNFNLCKAVTSKTNTPQSQKSHHFHITNPNLKS
jgi:hypothetical protein